MFSERIWNNNNHSKRYPFGMPTTENRAKLKDPRIYHPINQVDESSKMQRVNVFQQRLNKGMKPNIPKQYKELLITPPTPLTKPDYRGENISTQETYPLLCYSSVLSAI